MRILHAIHDFLPRHRAGSELYADRLARALVARGHEVAILCAEFEPGRPHGELRWRFHDGLPVVEVVNNWSAGRFGELGADPRLDAVLGQVLDAIAPEVLHVHNLLNLSLELPALARRRGIPVVATLHEFTLLCPSGGQRVHQAEAHVCHEIDVERCARCFRQSAFFGRWSYGRALAAVPGPRVGRLAAGFRARFPRTADRLFAAADRMPGPSVQPAEIRRRLERVVELFSEVDRWVAPSPSLGADVVRFGCPPERLEVSDYGFPPLTVERRPRSGELRIGFVGTLVWHKGAHVLVEAVRQLPPEGWTLAIHGDPAVHPEYAAALGEAARGWPIELVGGFPRERVGEVYGGLDLLVVASLWPENSPLVIHEAFQAGVPVVGARIGGIADLVDEGESGLLYDPFDPADLARALRSLLDAPERIAAMAARLPAVKSIEADASEWEARYEALGGAGAPAPRRRGGGVTAVVVNHRTPEETLLAARSLAPADEVVVVENGSRDGSAGWLRRHLPASVRLLVEAENLGFSGGVNVGLRWGLERGAERCLLLNSDAILAGDALPLLESALAAEGVGLAAPVLLARTSPGTVASAGLSFERWSGRMKHRGVGRPWVPGPATRVPAASGCALLVRREVLETVGLLDEAYFFSFEDLDLCLAAAAAGWRTVVVPAARAWHAGGGTLDERSPDRLYYGTRNHLRLVARRARPPAPFGLVRAGVVVALGLAHALATSRAPRGEAVRAVVRGLADHLRGRYGPLDPAPGDPGSGAARAG